ncbi:MFS transporter [Streptacidiphilus jiangxiensis]|uniref:Predicted arabinose efflux permease, MFS family n=1 Tax=Streptacidiphilus jiangxiensis TaxID=235985 RepID=A0A1H7VJ90_STRJI|nr:MFS transporter [Streptacidiphilus jiangxiensis]SEM08878.1 Predicted arabinose efflux permease, MFS family [Streptacidiphilus jiangxiensis]
MDLTPWRGSRDFRLLWTAGAVTLFGSFLTMVALPLELKALTGSTLAVGAVGAVELGPLVVCGLWGGALADAWDRRRIVLRTEAVQGLCSLGLVVDTLLPHPAVWPLYLVAACSSAASALQRPSIDALTPQLVGRDQQTAAAALNSVRWSVGAIVGPALAGLIATTAGIGVAFEVDLATFVVSVLLLARLRPVPPAPDAERASVGSLVTGLRYARGRPDLLGSYAVDIAAMLFAMPVAVFPFLAERLHAAWALGLMYASFAVGSLLVSVTSAWASRVHRYGRWIVAAACCWGAAIAGAGLLGDVWAVLACLVLAGGADMVSGLFRASLWNSTIPDELRGRLAGVELLSYSVGPQLASVRAGWTAAAMGVRTSVWAGGVACVVGVGALALALPGLWRFDARSDPHALALAAHRAAAAEPACDEVPTASA